MFPHLIYFRMTNPFAACHRPNHTCVSPFCSCALQSGSGAFASLGGLPPGGLPVKPTDNLTPDVDVTTGMKPTPGVGSEKSWSPVSRDSSMTSSSHDNK